MTLRYWLPLLAFGIGIFADIAWTRWTLASNRCQRITAAHWTVATILCSYLTAWFVRESDWSSAAGFALGGWLGTFLAVKPAKPH